ncbi:MAG TPA: AMP-binding protein [Myxococcota bacterium]|nr:AMP-binding protein [Myxococcota bacterium]
MNLYALFRSRFPADPAATFLEREDGPPLTYAELDAATARMAAELAARGVARGDRVAVQVEKSAEAVLVYLACLRRGAIFVPLNPAYTDAETAYLLSDAEPRLFVCDPARQPAQGPDVATLDAAGRGSLDAWRERAPDAAIAESAGSDVAAILYTSGTTGRPKGAMLTHRNLAANAEALVALWRFERGDALLHALPIFHAHGLFVALHCALLAGCRVIFLARFDAARVAALLPRATVFMGVPTHYARLLGLADFGREACRGMRLFVSGSAPLTAAAHREFAERTGHAILERYGMTETVMITSNTWEDRHPGKVGWPLPGVELRVVDDARRALPSGETGALEVRGPSVFAGYWRLPEKTREDLLPDGFFRTGDLACIDANGCVTLVGRARDLVISGGLNVYPAEVEQALDALPGVAESAVIGVAHPDLGEAVTAVVAPDGSRALDESAIRAALGDRLARFKHPKRVFFVDALPRNAMGKVQKAQLRERFGDVYAPRAGVRE